MLNPHQRLAITAEISQLFALWNTSPAPLWAEDLWAAMETPQLYQTLANFTQLKARLNLG